jgi:hypothetical protein
MSATLNAEMFSSYFGEYICFKLSRLGLVNLYSHSIFYLLQVVVLWLTYQGLLFQWRSFLLRMSLRWQGMYSMRYVRYKVCTVCGMYGMWYVRYVVCTVCGMYSMRYVRYVVCTVWGMYGMWYVRYVSCHWVCSWLCSMPPLS